MRYGFLFFCFFFCLILFYSGGSYYLLIHNQNIPRTKWNTMLVHFVRLYSLFLPILPLSYIFLFLCLILGLYISIPGLHKFGIEHLLTYRTKYIQNQKDHPLGPFREIKFSLTTTSSPPPSPPPFFYFLFFPSCFLVLVFYFYYFVLKFVFHFTGPFVLFCSVLFLLVSGL